MPGRLKMLIEAPRGARPGGTVVQAAVLELVQGVAPELSQRLHEGGTPPRYHTALLPAARRDQRLLYVGLADEADFRVLIQAWMRRPPQKIRIGVELLPIAELDADDHDSTWDQLLRRDVARVRLRFQSPTLFRAPSLGADGPRPVRVFPSPERVIDSLARRWTAYAPSPIVSEGLAELVNETDMRGEVVDWGGTHPIRGFVGTVTWSIGGRRPEICALLGLGEQLGVGSRTAQGCGHLEVELP